MVNSLLSEYGLAENDIKKRDKLLSGFFELRDETFYKYVSRLFSFLESVGYSKKQISQIAKKSPQLIGFSSNLLELKIKKMQELGFSMEQIIKMTVSLPQIYSYSVERLEDRFQYLKSLGYTKAQIIKMASLFPSMFSYCVDNINDKIAFLLSIGYTKEQILQMTSLISGIYGHSDDNIMNKINFLISLGYTKEEVLKMTLLYPGIFSTSVDATKEKVDFLKEIGLKDFLVEKPKNLIQSVDLTYARFKYLTLDKSRSLDKTTIDYLFTGAKAFEKIFGISKEELLARYSYDLDVRSKNKGKLLK